MNLHNKIPTLYFATQKHRIQYLTACGLNLPKIEVGCGNSSNRLKVHWSDEDAAAAPAAGGKAGGKGSWGVRVGRAVCCLDNESVGLLFIMFVFALLLGAWRCIVVATFVMATGDVDDAGYATNNEPMIAMLVSATIVLLVWGMLRLEWVRGVAVLMMRCVFKESVLQRIQRVIFGLGTHSGWPRTFYRARPFYDPRYLEV